MDTISDADLLEQEEDDRSILNTWQNWLSVKKLDVCLLKQEDDDNSILNRFS